VTSNVVVVTVKVPVTGVTLNTTALTKTVGDSPETLIATVVPSDAANKTVTWSSSDSNVAAVSGTGVVSAIAEGTAVITVTTVDGNKTATCTVTVESVPPVPVFAGLQEEYVAGSPSVSLKVKGAGSEQLTVIKVDGHSATAFNPSTKGEYKIEASSPDGKLKIKRIIKVK
jgi:transglutaminase/protease-like cytokinesis protein 3